MLSSPKNVATSFRTPESSAPGTRRTQIDNLFMSVLSSSLRFNPNVPSTSRPPTRTGSTTTLRDSFMSPFILTRCTTYYEANIPLRLYVPFLRSKRTRSSMLSGSVEKPTRGSVARIAAPMLSSPKNVATSFRTPESSAPGTRRTQIDNLFMTIDKGTFASAQQQA
ncbi:hypothetical protein BDW22DRAFT_1433063 [Trametopsis cervina]|nr:hypothetical protein BDW22DRAFT_1433063 [Trametopsis cervina]